MHSLGDLAPAGDLLGRVQARGVLIALSLGRHLSGLRDDQAGRGALGVVGGGQFAGYQPRACAIAGQRRHDKTIGECQAPKGVGLEKRLVGHIASASGVGIALNDDDHNLNCQGFDDD